LKKDYPGYEDLFNPTDAAAKEARMSSAEEASLATRFFPIAR
jgi:hypothetical protein